MISTVDIDRPSWERILPNQFDVDTLRHLGDAALASAMLRETSYNPAKIAGRQRELRQQPELHLRVDTARLRSVAEYIAFKCHPNCSVARDQARQGSDIDGALVVLPEPISLETEIAFVDELKTQGFKVCHARDVQAINEAWNAWWARVRSDEAEGFTAEESQRLDEEFFKLEPGHRLLPLKQVTFVTEADMQERAQHGPLTPELAIYLSGHSI